MSAVVLHQSRSEGECQNGVKCYPHCSLLCTGDAVRMASSRNRAGVSPEMGMQQGSGVRQGGRMGQGTAVTPWGPLHPPSSILHPPSHPPLLQVTQPQQLLPVELVAAPCSDMGGWRAGGKGRAVPCPHWAALRPLQLSSFTLHKAGSVPQSVATPAEAAGIPSPAHETQMVVVLVCCTKQWDWAAPTPWLRSGIGATASQSRGSSRGCCRVGAGEEGSGACGVCARSRGSDKQEEQQGHGGRQ